VWSFLVSLIIFNRYSNYENKQKNYKYNKREPKEESKYITPQADEEFGEENQKEIEDINTAVKEDQEVIEATHILENKEENSIQDEEKGTSQEIQKLSKEESRKNSEKLEAIVKIYENKEIDEPIEVKNWKLELKEDELLEEKQFSTSKSQSELLNKSEEKEETINSEDESYDKFSDAKEFYSEFYENLPNVLSSLK